MLFGGISAQVAALVLLALMGSAIPLIGRSTRSRTCRCSSRCWCSRRRAPARPRAQRHAWKFLDVAALFAISVGGAAGLYFLTHEFAAEPVPSQAVLTDVVLVPSVIWVLGAVLVARAGHLATVRARLVRARFADAGRAPLPSRVRRIRALSRSDRQQRARVGGPCAARRLIRAPDGPRHAARQGVRHPGEIGPGQEKRFTDLRGDRGKAADGHHCQVEVVEMG
jgi:hypothetical protein